MRTPSAMNTEQKLAVVFNCLLPGVLESDVEEMALARAG